MYSADGSTSKSKKNFTNTEPLDTVAQGTVSGNYGYEFQLLAYANLIHANSYIRQ